MPKWVVAGLALVAIAVAAYVLSQPRKGEMEWHKAEYFNPKETSVWDRLARSPVVPAVVQRQYEQRKVRTLEFHERKLIKAGLLKESAWVLTNGWPPVLRLQFSSGLGHAK